MTDQFDTSEQDQSSSVLLSNLPIIIWHRKWFVIVPWLLISLAALIAAFVLPRVYEANAVLLVESQDLPGVGSDSPQADVIDRRIAKIRQQILSRPDLVDLIQAHNLYDASEHKEPLSKLVERMRDATELSAVDADIAQGKGGKGNSGSIAFALKFDYPKASEAQLVAQTFVNRLLTLDASQSQSTAQSNVHFLQDQQTALQGQLSQIEGQMNQITGQNGSALAGASGLGMITIGGGDYEGQIENLRRENAQLLAQTGNTAVGRDPAVVTAEAQLAAARAKFSEGHPDVIAAKAQLAAAKANASAFQTNAVASTVQRQIAVNNQSIAELERAKGAAQGKAASLAAAQARGPAVAQQVSQLQARAEQVRTELGKITSNLMNAQSVQKLTAEQRGERLTLIDPPVTPDRPTKPNLLVLIGGGIVAGLGLGLALALLVEAIHRPIRSVAKLTQIVGSPPIAVVPIISTKRKARRRARRKSKNEGYGESA